MTHRKLNSRWETEVFIIQAQSRQSLIGAVRQMLQLISERSEIALKDLAYSLNCPLKASNYRLAFVADSLKDLEKKLTYSGRRLEDTDCMKIKDRSGIYFFEAPLSREGSLAFLFPGEGSQYANMLSDLCIHFPEVRSCFDRADRVFIENERNPLPSQVALPPPHASPETRSTLERALFSSEYAIPLVYTANYGLKKLLDRLEISPQALVGHSTGETIAALASGMAVDMDEDSQFQRSLEDHIQGLSIVQEIPSAKLLSVGAMDHTVVAAIAAESDGELFVTMDNCPNQVVICGSEAAIEVAYNSLKKKGAICSFLRFEHALHTPWYKPICEQHIQFVRHVKIQPPKIETYSCTTTQPFPQDVDEIRRIAADQWAKPVRFRETIEAMYAEGVRIFVEVGPRGNLTSFVDDILAKRRYLAVPSNLHNRSGITQVNHMIGLLAAHGVSMRLDYLYEGRSPKRVSMDKAEHSNQQKEKSAVVVKLTHEPPQIKINSDSQNIKFPGTRRSLKSNPTTGAGDILTPGQNKAAGKKTQHQENFHDYSRQLVNEALEVVSHFGPAGSSHSQKHSRSKVMQEYFNTMDNFLNVQQEIMKTFVDKKRSAVMKFKKRRN